ncbi:hypothetical protein [Salinactinospora qingdaonensis]|uniref:hypothetical protein n=1 Tax=Salinactinospora qingdaonensis TaxID=702744 RepID=UPI0031E5E004
MDRVKQWSKIALVAFVAFYLLTQPESAAGVIDAGMGGIMSAADSLSRFVNALAV